MGLGPIVMTSKVTDLHFDAKGRRRMSLEYKAEKGKVFVFLALTITKPEELTAELVSKIIKHYAEQKWEFTGGSETKAASEPQGGKR